MLISVIICTHNPRRDYLERTLDSLRSQSLDRAEWELIVVDNQSSPPVVGMVDLSWHARARVVIEAELGLTPARLRGIEEARADVLLFVDDDNVLNDHYLEETLKIFTIHPAIGCIGAGSLTPEFESEPLPETCPYLSYLALREVKEDYWGNQISGFIPWGAGLCVRKCVGEHYRSRVKESQASADLGRKGGSLMSGEDDEFSHVAVGNGWGVGIFVSLKIVHLIASRRLTKEYLERLIEANGATRAYLAHLHGEDLFNPFRPTTLGRLFGLAGQVPARTLAKALYGYFTLLRASRFVRRMAQIQFDGWTTGAAKVKRLGMSDVT